MRRMLEGLAPVVAADTRLVVLGSFPGVASLVAQQYYGHPRNAFWALVGAVIGVDLRVLAYAERLDALRAHGVGLWDVIARAERQGSLDAAIRNETHNPLVDLVASLPRLTTIAFNGGTAARLGRRELKAVADRFELIDLPSSSPAHTLAFDDKLRAWGRLAGALR
jgi:TDG/mug DNA glycosylase family protein